MKNKFNRILSSLLVTVMLFASVAVLVPPVSANAACSSDVESTANYTEDEIKEILSKTIEYDFETAEEMLRYELCDKSVWFDRNGNGVADDGETYTKTKNDTIDTTGNYLTSVTSADGRYTIYVNNYSGYVYYVDNLTGQIITSNPYNVKGLDADTRQNLAAQVEVAFSLATAASDTATKYNSYKWAALYSQISVSRIANGLRVNYTIGDTTTRFLLPGAITAEAFDEYILIPMIEEYEATLAKYAKTSTLVENFAEDEESYKHVVKTGYTSPVIELDFMSTDKLKAYIQRTDSSALSKLGKTSAEYKEIHQVGQDIIGIIDGYVVKNPLYKKKVVSECNLLMGENDMSKKAQADLDRMYEAHPITRDDVAVYVWSEASGYGSDAVKRSFAKTIIKYCTELNFSIMYEEEELCNYVSKVTKKPSFRCVLEYTFNDDGSINITLPANSIIFDESTYILKSITPLKYFGAGDMSTCEEGGYVFYPDGSGTIIDFKDFYATGINVMLQSQIFGQDYCYSSVTGAHREQITMPVYGVVSAVKANETTKANMNVDGYVENGYFAIIEEGASLAELGVESTANYMYAYTSYVPFSLDFISSDNISVSGVKGYTKVTESKYNGSYVTRIVMLSDSDFEEKIALSDSDNKCYNASTYVGMATYYRNYLINSGVLSALPVTDNELPLYIEALGAMEVVEKILTFPVTVSKQLTTFEHIELMYNELSNAKATFTNKALEYTSLAEAITGDTAQDANLKQKYLDYAEMYRNLSNDLDNVTNVNFKLNGFTNGGLSATYPVKLKWESVCGGNKGFKQLIDAAKAISAESGKNFGVYPDFDFMYVNNTALFDGIGIKKTVSKMVDNRYASKQEYNAITGIYDVLASMVVSSDNLASFVDKLLNKYDDYGWKYISVSTMGSDLNSNFDEDNPIHREASVEYVKEALGKLGEYQVMLDKGNVYTAAYADHIIGATIDSSHFRYSSYTVPFFGMILHGYVNYTGSAFNYTGSPKYDMLRAIENGSALYYILCYENTPYLKEDPSLNKYYGIDYKNWFDDIVKAYNELNGLIGNLQNHIIVDHKILFSERKISEEDYRENIMKLIMEILVFVKKQTQEAVDAKYDELHENSEGYDSVKVTFDIDAIKEEVVEKLFLNSVDELDSFGFDALFEQNVKNYFDTEYPADSDKNQVNIEISDFEYHYNDETCTECGGALDKDNKCTKIDKLGNPDCDNTGVVVYKYRSAYSLVTNSDADDEDYRSTKYTSVRGNVVLVTYERTVNDVTETVSFILNYNTYDVTVRLDGVVYPVEKYGYYKIG